MSGILEGADSAESRNTQQEHRPHDEAPALWGEWERKPCSPWNQCPASTALATADITTAMPWNWDLELSENLELKGKHPNRNCYLHCWRKCGLGALSNDQCLGFEKRGWFTSMQSFQSICLPDRKQGTSKLSLLTAVFSLLLPAGNFQELTDQ